VRASLACCSRPAPSLSEWSSALGSMSDRASCNERQSNFRRRSRIRQRPSPAPRRYKAAWPGAEPPAQDALVSDGASATTGASRSAPPQHHRPWRSAPALALSRSRSRRPRLTDFAAPRVPLRRGGRAHDVVTRQRYCARDPDSALSMSSRSQSLRRAAMDRPVTDPDRRNPELEAGVSSTDLREQDLADVALRPMPTMHVQVLATRDERHRGSRPSSHATPRRRWRQCRRPRAPSSRARHRRRREPPPRCRRQRPAAPPPSSSTWTRRPQPRPQDEQRRKHRNRSGASTSAPVSRPHASHRMSAVLVRPLSP